MLGAIGGRKSYMFEHLREYSPLGSDVIDEWIQGSLTKL